MHMMIRKSIFLLWVFFVVFAKSQNSSASCDKDFSNYIDCVRRDHKSSGEIIDTIDRNRISRCFTDNQCEAPTFDRDPVSDLPQPIRSAIEKINDEVANAPLKVTTCVKNKFSKIAGQQIKVCSSSSSIFSNVSVEQLAAMDFGDAGDGYAVLNNGKVDTQQMLQKQKKFFLRVAIARGLRLCQDKQANSMNRFLNALQCVQTAMSANTKNTFLEASKSCHKNSSASCKQQRFDAMRLACQCQQKTHAQLLNKLDELRKNDSVPIIDLMSILGNGDPLAICASVHDCYVENDESMPPSIIVLSMFISQQKEKHQNDKLLDAAQTRVDQKALGAIRDMLNTDGYQQDYCRDYSGIIF